MKSFMFVLLSIFLFNPYATQAQDRCLGCGGKCYEDSLDGNFCDEGKAYIAEQLTFKKNNADPLPPCSSCSGACYESGEQKNMCNYGKTLADTLDSVRNHHEYIKDATIHCQSENSQGLVNGFTLNKSLNEYVFRGGSGYECGYHNIIGAYSFGILQATRLRSIRQVFQKYNNTSAYDAICEREDSTYGSNSSLNQYVSYNGYYPLKKSSFYNGRTWLKFHFSNDLHSEHFIEGYFFHQGKTIWEEEDSQFKGQLIVGRDKVIINMTCKTLSH